MVRIRRKRGGDRGEGRLSKKSDKPYPSFRLSVFWPESFQTILRNGGVKTKERGKTNPTHPPFILGNNQQWHRRARTLSSTMKLASAERGQERNLPDRVCSKPSTRCPKAKGQKKEKKKKKEKKEKKKKKKKKIKNTKLKET